MTDIVDNNRSVRVVREVDLQIVEVIGAGPPGPPGLPNPVTDGSDSLGTTSLRWDGLWLYPGSAINWDSGDLTLTHSANLLTLSGGVMEFSSRPTFSGSNILAASDIGVTVQAYDPDLQSWLAINRAAGFDTFVTTPTVANLAALLTDEAANFTNFLVTPSVANLMAFLTDDAAGLGTFMVTPSSANLRTLVTDETGTGALVFGTTPTFTTSMLLASGFVMNWNASDVTLTHSADTLTLAGGTLVLPASGLQVGSSNPFSDSAGTLTLQNVDALDATTETTIEAAIDTLANLTSIQSRTVSFGGNISFAGAFTTAGAVTISTFAATYLDDADAATTRATLGLTIGTNVQAWDADLNSWALLTRAAGFDTFVVTPSVANLMSLLTNDAAGLGDFMVTPSSANLRTLVTDETGSGALVFGTSPTFTTSMLLSSGFVMNWNSSDVTLTHSVDTLTLAGGTLVLPASGLQVGSSNPFSDSAGTLTLQNVDALDATTESTIEAAIDTLANLTSIQGVSFTFGSYAATLLNTTSEATFKAAVNLEIGVDVQAYDAELAALAGVTSAADKVPYFTGAGTAAVADFTSAGRSMIAAASAAAQTALLSVFVGDSGSGGTKGLVPAPVAGDSTKFLRGDGTFVTIPGGGDALTANSLAQFAATTSAQLAGVISNETGSGALVFATSPTLVTPILGTPTSGTLTNCTGLPLSGVVDSTSEALGVGTLEVGHASDTTLSRSSAGNLAVEGNLLYRAGGTDVPVADGGTGASTASDARTNLGINTAQLEAVFDNGTITLTTGVKGEMRVPFACTVTSWTLVADVSGSVVIDIWRDTLANYPPVDGDSITASAPPTLSSVAFNSSSTLTGWTTSLNAGDILRFNIDSVATIKRVTLSLAVTRA